MADQEALLDAIRVAGKVQTSKDLIGVAGYLNFSDLHNALYSLKKRGKIKFRERHLGGDTQLARISILERRERMLAEAPTQQEEIVELVEEPQTVDSDKPAEEAKPKTYKDVFIDWIARQPRDAKGWVMTTTGEIAGHLDVEIKVVQNAINRLERAEEIEVLRADIGSAGRPRVIGVRLMDDAKAERKERVAKFVHDVWHTVPETPELDRYLEARMMASNSQWLKFTPDPIYEEARSLKEHLEHVLESG